MAVPQKELEEILLSNQDAAATVKGYADIIASMVETGTEVSNEALQIVWEGRFTLSERMKADSTDSAAQDFVELP